MKPILLILLALCFWSCDQDRIPAGSKILNNSIAAHDSSNQWRAAKLNFHIQEPRISKPFRYSVLMLDNSTNTFELSRNRDHHISTHGIESDGNSFVLLDGEPEIDSVLVKKYRLDPSRNAGYRSFYQLYYGLPMSLNQSIGKILNTTEQVFNNEECYKLEIELKEKVISSYWHLFISKSTMQIRGIEIIFPDEPDNGERIYFDKLLFTNGMKIPRVRHWHELSDDSYSGTDIIVKEIPE